MTIDGICPSRSDPPRMGDVAHGRGHWSTVARRCPRSVTLLGAAASGEVHVITAATFGVVSVDPPLVSVTVGARGRTRALIEGGRGFAVSLLSSAHEPVADRCALPGRRTAWPDLPASTWWAAPHSSAPLLREAPAWVDCRLHVLVDLAGQALVVGSVEHAGTGPDAAPLLRFDGAYHPLLPAGVLRTRRGGDQP